MISSTIKSLLSAPVVPTIWMGVEDIKHYFENKTKKEHCAAREKPVRHCVARETPVQSVQSLPEPIVLNHSDLSEMICLVNAHAKTLTTSMADQLRQHVQGLEDKPLESSFYPERAEVYENNTLDYRQGFQSKQLALPFCEVRI